VDDKKQFKDGRVKSKTTDSKVKLDNRLRKLLGLRLREFRKKRNLTQSQLIKTIGFGSVTEVSLWESGKRFVPWQFIYAICAKYNVDMNYFHIKLDKLEPSEMEKEVRNLLYNEVLKNGVEAEEIKDSIPKVVANETKPPKRETKASEDETKPKDLEKVLADITEEVDDEEGLDDYDEYL
jgi:transcriptional regulator with XRE-family HTH domain